MHAQDTPHLACNEVTAFLLLKSDRGLFFLPVFYSGLSSQELRWSCFWRNQDDYSINHAIHQITGHHRQKHIYWTLSASMPTTTCLHCQSQPEGLCQFLRPLRLEGLAVPSSCTSTWTTPSTAENLVKSVSQEEDHYSRGQSFFFFFFLPCAHKRRFGGFMATFGQLHGL